MTLEKLKKDKNTDFIRCHKEHKINKIRAEHMPRVV